MGSPGLQVQVCCWEKNAPVSGIACLLFKKLGSVAMLASFKQLMRPANIF